ncbi:hypothetical protein H4S07_001675 [Coemansia furcata]|uniref:Uncharacterized protein n=1 Tax=Coemansia furcata TaxID=417177 RepID=A0ACC1LN45_9FUNG|nr:hypothetical protein H4S07_001675 [Coemansia furcata]
MVEFAANPFDGCLPASPSEEAIEALHADSAPYIDDALKSLRKWGAEYKAYLAKSQADALEAANLDHKEYYYADKRFSYKKTIEAAEEEAGPVRPLTEAQAMVLQAAYDDAAETAQRGTEVAECIAMDNVDLWKKKMANESNGDSGINYVHHQLQSWWIA